ncbi:MAG: hypothetical protein BWZ01_01163 [Deltaproteobacteria bacterium ADurb.BinA179]|nr:MAG: hypothetical protein BWZ01_01163 [Deltaproteobacteria bacterium ADurb.BinA179]
MNSLLHFSDMTFRGMPEVLEETIVSGLRTPSMRAKRSCLIFGFSTTTSTIQSQSASLLKSSSRLPVVMRAASAFEKNSGGFAFIAASSPAVTIRFLALGSFFSSSFRSKGTMSSSNTSTPAPARRAAMPPPMIPDPITAAFLIFLTITTSSVYGLFKVTSYSMNHHSVYQVDPVKSIK